MIPHGKRMNDYFMRFDAFGKFTKAFDNEFDGIMNETLVLTKKIQTMMQEMKGYENTYTKEKVLRLMKLLKMGSAYLRFRTDVYNENAAMQVYITDYYNMGKKHFEAVKDVSPESLKKMMDAVEELEKEYIPKAKRMIKENREKLPLILQKHEEVKKLYSVFEI